MFELCKDTFPNEATIECIENRLPGTIDITIMAIPCDGIVECLDGRDENCDNDKLILIIATSLLFLTTIGVYVYLILIKLPFWNDSVLRFSDDGNIQSKLWPSDCSEMKGNTLANLKVLLFKKYFDI